MCRLQGESDDEDIGPIERLNVKAQKKKTKQKPAKKTAKRKRQDSDEDEEKDEDEDEESKTTNPFHMIDDLLIRRGITKLYTFSLACSDYEPEPVRPFEFFSLLPSSTMSSHVLAGRWQVFHFGQSATGNLIGTLFAVGWTWG